MDKTPFQKMFDGEPYVCDGDELNEAFCKATKLCFEYNNFPEFDIPKREEMIRKIFGSVGKSPNVLRPMHCDVGFRVSVGDNFFSNFNLVLIDQGGITIGDNVFIGPNVTLITTNHPLDAVERATKLIENKPVVIGNDVWLCANVTVLPGVTIGDRSVVGAGSVVTKDVEPDSVYVGNPARKIRDLK